MQFYAERLNTTPQNLNAICRKELNKTASDVVAEHIIKEVKRRLIYSNESISEIAFSLDFKDSAYPILLLKIAIQKCRINNNIKNPTSDRVGERPPG